MVNPHCYWITYAHPVHKGVLKEYGLPTLLLNGTYVVNMKVYWKNTVCPTLLLNNSYIANTKVYWKNTVCSILLLNDTYPVCMLRTQSFTYQNRELYTWWYVLQCLKHRREKNAIEAGPRNTRRKRDQVWSLAHSANKPFIAAMYQFYCDEILNFSSSVVTLFSLVTFIVFYVTHSSCECIQNSLKSCQTI